MSSRKGCGFESRLWYQLVSCSQLRPTRIRASGLRRSHEASLSPTNACSSPSTSLGVLRATFVGAPRNLARNEVSTNFWGRAGCAEARMRARKARPRRADGACTRGAGDGIPPAGPGLPGVFDASVNPANPNATYIRMLLHRLERVMGFAPTASSLARKRSTAELHPHRL